MDEHPPKECPECGSTMTWWEYRKPIPKYGGGLSYGRYVCGNYGGCEYAAG